jgi:hypothetical protein
MLAHKPNSNFSSPPPAGWVFFWRLLSLPHYYQKRKLLVQYIERAPCAGIVSKQDQATSNRRAQILCAFCSGPENL